MRSLQVTIKDIAKQLGISASTVSRALKDHPDISEKTKIKVKALAKELNYKPNAIALSLQSSKSNIIGIIVPQIVHHFFSTVISGIEEYAGKKGYNVLICQSNESVDKEIINTQTLISSRVDGIIVSRTKNTEDFKHFRNIQNSFIPLVFFDRTCHGLKTDKVIIDDYKAAYEATEYLISTGCKNIVHFSGPENLKISSKRMWGFRDALKKNSIPFKEEYIINADNLEDGQNETEKLIRNNKIPDGIFAVNDMTAAGAINALKKNNIKIPDKVSVIGFTNGLISAITDPPLTTVEQNGYIMGCKSAKLLINRIENIDAPLISEIIPTKLIIRDTTKKN
ncbi:MAG: LacI family transcriptional regulator [Bacteroidales bacterium]|nr:LacI family transcriptional regulator [Bacteroidales bacterium]